MLDINDIGNDELSELAMMILSKDDLLASEATGPDNPAWDKTMMPVLYEAMKHVNEELLQHSFAIAYRNGVIDYLRPRIEKLFNEQLEILNEDYQCED